MPTALNCPLLKEGAMKSQPADSPNRSLYNWGSHSCKQFLKMFAAACPFTKMVSINSLACRGVCVFCLMTSFSNWVMTLEVCNFSRIGSTHVKRWNNASRYFRIKDRSSETQQWKDKLSYRLLCLCESLCWNREASILKFISSPPPHFFLLNSNKNPWEKTEASHSLLLLRTRKEAIFVFCQQKQHYLIHFWFLTCVRYWTIFFCTEFQNTAEAAAVLSTRTCLSLSRLQMGEGVNETGIIRGFLEQELEK